MDWKAAIAQIKSMEGAAEATAAIETEINRLTNANFELVKDVRSHSAKSKEAEAKLTDLLQLLGAEGEDLKARVSVANTLVKDLQTQNTQLTQQKTEIEQNYKTLQDESLGLKRTNAINTAAAKTGASVDVLTSLTRDLPLERIAIENDSVSILSEDGKTKTALKDYATSHWNAFIPALFPTSNQQQQPTRLPNGSPESKQPDQPSPLRSYQAGTYDKTISRLTKQQN